MTNEEKSNAISELIEEFLWNAEENATIASEGYPHGSYVESLGVDVTETLVLIAEVNKILGIKNNLEEITKYL